ncbi:MAG: bacterial Ig-like domain-containing protein, partial [Bacteroidales bacterium]|nr:bacterial Ig-like domain-containing protein [Bacteroidales bacterium]
MKKLFTLLILAILATATGFAETWVQTAITDLQDGDIVVIFDKSSKRALSNDNGTSAAPKAVSVAVSENATEITEDVAENIQWEFYKSGSNFQFKKPSTNNYLYCTNANNGVRVGTNTNRDFALDGNHMKNIGTSRFVGVYNNQDWRCYTSKTTNITNTQTIFFKKVSATLQSIAIEGTPTKTAYNAGETFSTAGLTVKGTYSDDSQKEITQGITWTITPTPLTVGTTSVAVKAAVENVESPVVNYDVTVSEPITLTGLSVAGTAPALWKGDAFSTTGLTFTASFSDGNTQEIAHSNLTFSGYNMNAAGEQTVTASYTYVDVTETATFPINVQTIANTKESAYSVAQAIALIDAGKDLATQVYVKGIVSTIVTAWSDQYMNITFDVSEDGSTTGQQFQFYRNGLKNGAAYTEDPNIEVGATVIGLGTLKKYNTTYEFDANNDLVEYTAPAQKVLESIAISGTPSKTTYEAGESFSTAGLTVMGTYNDGSSADVTANAEWSIEPATLSVGTTSVDVMANVGEVVSDIATYNVTVTAPRVLTALTISGEPTKTAYYAGETFDPAGLVVTATYSNDDTEVITEGLEWDFDPETLALGTTSVDVAVAIGAVMSDVITYNVTVTAAPQPTSAYIDLTKDETTTATTDKLEWVKDAVTVTSSKETSSTNANNYYPGSGGRTSTRFYKDFKLTFAPANGITISSIVYEATSASYASVMANSTWTNATASVDGLTVTITPVDGAQTVSAKIGAATGGESFTINFTGATKTPTTLSFGENIDGQTITKYIGEEDLDYTATLTPAIEGATITYESSNDAIALIDETTGYVVLGQTEGTAVITAKYAGNDAYKPSEASYTIDLKKLPVPTFNPAAGAVDAGTVVTVSTIEGCTLLYYVNDGEVVETETNTATVAINEATTIVATTKKGALESDEVVASYTIKPANPFTLAISPATGEYDGPQTVTITATNGVGEVAITYTTDGTDPAVSETAQYYEAPFTVSETTTIKAYAYDQVGQSAEAEVTITI